MTQHTQTFWSALGIWYFLGSEFDYLPKTTQVAWVKVETDEETWWGNMSFLPLEPMMVHAISASIQKWTFEHSIIRGWAGNIPVPDAGVKMETLWEKYVS